MTDSRHWILDEDRQPVEVDLFAWAVFFEDAANRIVDKTTVGNVEVSTVFLGLDHQYNSDGELLLFETMIFGGGDDIDQQCCRCTTWEQAEQMHKDAVTLLTELQSKPKELT